MKIDENALLDLSEVDLQLLLEELERRESEKNQLGSRIEELESEVERLKKQVALLQKWIFGKKPEKIIGDVNDQQLILPGLENLFSGEEDKKEEDQPKPEPSSSRGKPRTGLNSLKYPDNLPVEEVFIDLPEEEKFCKETGAPLVKIGEEISEKIAYKPGSYYIKRIIRCKYAIRENEEAGIFCPEMPTTILPKCKADDSLLADVAVKKFGDHLPLYRISEILSRQDIHISRKLLSQWMLRCGLSLVPLYNEMINRILSNDTVFIDESPVKFQKDKDVKTGYAWVLVGGEGKNPPYRIFLFKETRSHEHIFTILAGYEGFVHSDKYEGYVQLAKKGKIIWVPCWVHIRRQFFEAESGDPKFRTWILMKIRHLYLLEKVAWNRTPEERTKIRMEKEVPIIEEIIDRVKKRSLQGDLLPKSNFCKAIRYFLDLVPYLTNYTKNPFSRLDNNTAERAIRPLAIGRKNWLFFGSADAGQYSSVLVSFIQTCRNLGINPQEYLTDIFRRLLDHPANKLYELLPDQWLLSREASSADKA